MYRARTTAAQEQYNNSSSKYIAATITMAQALKHGRMQAHAESMLVNLVRDLKKGDLTNSKSCFLIELDLKLARFYERQAWSSEAQNYLRNR